MFCASTVQVIRKTRPRAACGIAPGMRSWNPIIGHRAKVVAFRQLSAPTGRVALLCTYLATVKALLDTITGEPRCRQKSGVRLTGSSNTWKLFMNFSIAKTIRRLLAPRHELSCSWFLWRRLLIRLRERGCGESRESGAFLLGDHNGQRTRIVDFVLYDDLDPHCLDTGIVRFDGRYFGKLWDICKKRNLTVVADVHVHPGGSQQSESDRTHPMISCKGHLALILPRFAANPLPRREVGIYRYQGAKQWQTIASADRRAFFHIGL